MSSTVPIVPGLHAHYLGALWVPETKTAVVADVHLGYGWAQRRRGELGPLADFRTREKLFRLSDELEPATLIFLGDLVHAPRPCTPEREWIEETLQELTRRAALLVIRGNHDRAFAREFAQLGLRTESSWTYQSFTAVHGDQIPPAMPESQTLIVGHLHPCLAIKDSAGADQKLPIFLASEGCIVMPAFSPFARGYDVRSGIPPELLSCFKAQEIRAYAVASSRVVSLGPLSRAIERMNEIDVGAPEQFRKRQASP